MFPTAVGWTTFSTLDPNEPERVIRAVDLGTSRWWGVHWGVGDSILTTVEVDVGHPAPAES